MTDDEAASLAVIRSELKFMREDVSDIQRRIEKMESDRQNVLVWGIIVLGSGVVGLLSIIGAFFGRQHGL